MGSSCETPRISTTADVNRILKVINGTMVNYYHVCKRKLWLFSKGLGREQDSTLVAIGKLLHEESFKRRKKEVFVLGRIRIDHTTKGENLIVHEVKKTQSQSHAALAQTRFYLYILKKLGVECKGEIHYVSERRRVGVMLDRDAIRETEEAIDAIPKVISSDSPPEIPSGAPCRRCSYKDYCRM